MQHHYDTPRSIKHLEPDLPETFAGCPEASDWHRSALAEWTAEHPARPHGPLLAFATFERYPPKDAWRDPNKARRFYLNQLAAWGYKLSDVERILTDDAWMRSSLRT